MKTFNYELSFSPFVNSVQAKNRKEAWNKIATLWPEYNIKTVVTLY